LVELKGESVEASQGQREAHLVLHSEANRVAGATGCNQLSGSYRLEGDRLSFGPLATTRMACMNGADVESRFLAALEDTTSYRVLADRLELYDDEGKLLALFAVQHLT
ncbi:META domain-containing protein, partial [Halomonas elongata]